MSNIHKNTLDCKIIEDILPLYYDGAVNDVTKNAVEDHLNDCEKCKKEYEKYSGVVFSCDNKSTSEEFVSLMKKKRKKQILTVIIASILSCSILAGGYCLLFKAHIKPVNDIEVKCVYKYTDDVSYSHKKIDKFFVVSSTANMSSCMSESRVYKEKGKVVYELNRYTTVVSKSSDDRYINTSGIEIVDFSKTGNDRYPDIDVFILNGKEVWSKEENGDDELPGFIDGWMDFENGNNDEFGNSDTVSWVDAEDYLASYYENPKREIRWDYDGNVIFDSAEKKQDK